MSIKSVTETGVNQTFAELLPNAVGINTQDKLGLIKNEAYEALHRLGLPGAKNEEYKFTPFLKFLGKSSFVKADTALSVSYPQPLSGMKGMHFHFINGQLQRENSALQALEEAGGSLLSLSDYISLKGDIPEFFQSYVPHTADFFAALNTALFEDAYVLHIPKNKAIEVPIWIHQHYVNHEERSVAVFPRIYFQAEQNAQATIVLVEDNQGKAFAAPVYEFYQMQDAHLHVSKLDLGDAGLIAVNHTQMHQLAKGHFTHVNISLAEGLVRNNLNLNLDTEHADGNMYGLYVLKGNAHVDNHTAVDHRKAHGESNELYKGIMSEKSTAVFNGKIFVRPQAQKTNAFQSNGNILLDDAATVHTKPQLEIWADDVKCSHGCTVGQLDEDALFYLRARGLSEKEAKAMLLIAFVAEATDKIPVEDLRNWVQEQIEERLGA